MFGLSVSDLGRIDTSGPHLRERPLKHYARCTPVALSQSCLSEPQQRSKELCSARTERSLVDRQRRFVASYRSLYITKPQEYIANVAIRCTNDITSLPPSRSS